MPLKNLGHVVLKVRDLDRTERLYTEVVGLRVAGRLPGKMVFFSAPGSDDSHDLAVGKVGAAARPQELRPVGLLHVAWPVERPAPRTRLSTAR